MKKRRKLLTVCFYIKCNDFVASCSIKRAIFVSEANETRTGFDDAVRNLRDIQREIKQIEESLGKDFGKEDEFAYLVGECYEYTDREYTYKLCPFDEVYCSFL